MYTAPPSQQGEPQGLGREIISASMSEQLPDAAHHLFPHMGLAEVDKTFSSQTKKALKLPCNTPRTQEGPADALSSRTPLPEDQGAQSAGQNLQPRGCVSPTGPEDRAPRKGAGSSVVPRHRGPLLHLDTE